MPQSYVSDAEGRLLKKAKEYLDTVSNPKVNYSVDCDPLMFKNNSISLNLGDYVTISDSDIGVNRAIRINGYTQSLLNPYAYTLELADEVFESVATKLIKTTNKLKGAVESTGIQQPEAARKVALADNTKAAFDSGVATNGKLLLGDNSYRVGFSGEVTSNPEKDIRLWAGAEEINKIQANLLILDNGKVISQKYDVVNGSKFAVIDDSYVGMYKGNWMQYGGHGGSGVPRRYVGLTIDPVYNGMVVFMNSGGSAIEGETTAITENGVVASDLYGNIRAFLYEYVVNAVSQLIDTLKFNIKINLPNIQTGGTGLNNGDLYKDSTGVVRVKQATNAGLSQTQAFKDGSGATKTMTITDGIITQIA
jgi:hypothetical protein